MRVHFHPTLISLTVARPVIQKVNCVDGTRCLLQGRPDTNKLKPMGYYYGNALDVSSAICPMILCFYELLKSNRFINDETTEY